MARLRQGRTERVQDDPSQLAAATRLISRCVAEGSTLFVAVTVVLELEWVLLNLIRSI